MTSSAHPEPFNEQLKVGLPLSALAGAAFPQLGYLASAASRAMPQRMRLPFGDNSQPAAIGGWLGGEIAPLLAPFGRTIATDALHDFYWHLFGSLDQKRDPGSGDGQNGTPQR